MNEYTNNQYERAALLAKFPGIAPHLTGHRPEHNGPGYLAAVDQQVSAFTESDSTGEVPDCLRAYMDRERPTYGLPEDVRSLIGAGIPHVGSEMVDPRPEGWQADPWADKRGGVRGMDTELVREFGTTLDFELGDKPGARMLVLASASVPYWRQDIRGAHWWEPKPEAVAWCESEQRAEFARQAAGEVTRWVPFKRHADGSRAESVGDWRMRVAAFLDPHTFDPQYVDSPGWPDAGVFDGTAMRRVVWPILAGESPERLAVYLAHHYVGRNRASTMMHHRMTGTWSSAFDSVCVSCVHNMGSRYQGLLNDYRAAHRDAEFTTRTASGRDYKDRIDDVWSEVDRLRAALDRANQPKRIVMVTRGATIWALPFCLTCCKEELWPGAVVLPTRLKARR
ncbi:hypothetical protein [Tsukamurella sp. USMM236]|uniref:hypothetical protein n=1 Tax=Tsukamurella sp. USMM236 TaxID=3081301 RepID=UPI003015B4D2